MAEVSNLKLKLTAVEKDRLDYEDRFRDTEVSSVLVPRPRARKHTFPRQFEVPGGVRDGS